jgi:hypothetical protein
MLQMSQPLSPDNGQTPNLLNLLAELAKHPDGLELTKLVYQLHMAQANSQPMPEEANRTRLIAIAMNLVKSQKIVTPPYFKGMSDDAIRTFIAQYLPKLDSDNTNGDKEGQSQESVETYCDNLEFLQAYQQVEEKRAEVYQRLAR